LSILTFSFWACQMEILEESLPETETTVQAEGPFQVQSVNKTLLNSLGRKMSKRTGFDVIESAQQRALSDFTFDLDASLLTTDTLKRRTYTVPFLEKGDKYSTFNLVMVADSVDNILDQYVLQYEFDSLQYQTYQQTKDLLSAGVTIKRFPLSSFFNDSSPGFLERCDGVSDANGDPVTCDQVSISGTPSGGGGGSGGSGSVWITPGGGAPYTPSTPGGGESCSWVVSMAPCSCPPHHTIACGCPGNEVRNYVITISCNWANRRESFKESLMTCMDCSVSDFGSPAFTMTRDATTIDNLLGGNLLTDWHLQYLSNNPSLSSELRAALMGDSSIDEDAALFTIAAGMNGAYTGNFNSNFAIEGLMTESTADFTNDYIIRLFQSYFEVRYAALKSINPSWSNGKLFYETSKEAIHLALDGIGLIEGFGTPADLLNAGLYYIEGDRLNGNLSLVAATPVIGFFSTTVKGALKLKGIIPGTTKRITQVWAKNGSEILFGGTRLRTAMGLTDPTKHAHHILPLEHANHPIIQKAAKSTNNPFHINELDNGAAVSAWQNTNHPSYNDRIKAILDTYNSGNPNATPEQAMVFLQGKMQELSQLIQNNPTVKINDLIFR
jgi:hypothetical protein